MLGKINKRLIFLFIIEILLCLTLLPGCFRKNQVIVSFDNELLTEGIISYEEQLIFKSKHIELLPGVYQIKAKTRLVDEQKIGIEMRCDSSYFNALRGNVINMSADDTSCNFNVYITDTVSTAYVQCDFYDTDASAIEQLEIYKTNYGSRILLFEVMAFCAVLDFFLLFHKRIAEQKVTNKQQIVFWSLAATVFLSYFPFLTDYFFFGKDTILYLNQLADAKNSLLFLFPIIMLRIGFPIMSVYKMLIFVIITITAIMSYLLIQKCVRDEYAALLGSVIYQLSVWRLQVLYEQAALNQSIMMLCLLLICCGIYLLWKRESSALEYKTYKWYVLLGFFGLVQCYFLFAKPDILDMIWIFVHLIVSILVAVLFIRARARSEVNFKIVASVVVLLNVFVVVYYVNYLIFNATPVYLYSIENLGPIRKQYVPKTMYQGSLIFLIAEAASVISFVILIVIGFINERKEGKHEK